MTPDERAQEAPGADGGEFHEFDGGASSSSAPPPGGESRCRSFFSLPRQCEEAVIAMLPESVATHLVNAQKEAVLAALRLGEMAIERLDEKAARVKEIHAAARKP
jgi:hypothetical protein